MMPTSSNSTKCLVWKVKPTGEVTAMPRLVKYCNLQALHEQSSRLPNGISLMGTFFYGLAYKEIWVIMIQWSNVYITLYNLLSVCTDEDNMSAMLVGSWFYSDYILMICIKNKVAEDIVCHFSMKSLLCKNEMKWKFLKEPQTATAVERIDRILAKMNKISHNTSIIYILHKKSANVAYKHRFSGGVCPNLWLRLHTKHLAAVICHIRPVDWEGVSVSNICTKMQNL